MAVSMQTGVRHLFIVTSGSAGVGSGVARREKNIRRHSRIEHTMAGCQTRPTTILLASPCEFARRGRNCIAFSIQYTDFMIG